MGQNSPPGNGGQSSSPSRRGHGVTRSADSRRHLGLSWPDPSDGYPLQTPTDIDDPGDLYRVPLAPVWIFGAGQIWERMEVELSFVGRAGGTSMTLPGPGRKSRTLDTSPTPQALSGTWVVGYLCEGSKPDHVFRHSANILPA